MALVSAQNYVLHRRTGLQELQPVSRLAPTYLATDISEPLPILLDSTRTTFQPFSFPSSSLLPKCPPRSDRVSSTILLPTQDPLQTPSQSLFARAVGHIISGKGADFTRSRRRFRIQRVFEGDKAFPLAQVGSYRPNNRRIYDIRGNAGEWCQDWFRWGYYQHSPPTNLQDPDRGVLRVIRCANWRFTGHACKYAKMRCEPSVKNPHT